MGVVRRAGWLGNHRGYFDLCRAVVGRYSRLCRNLYGIVELRSRCGTDNCSTDRILAGTMSGMYTPIHMFAHYT